MRGLRSAEVVELLLDHRRLIVQLPERRRQVTLGKREECGLKLGDRRLQGRASLGSAGELVDETAELSLEDVELLPPLIEELPSAFRSAA